ncbi:MAG TPA: hypothetical protein VMB77_09760 [Syntrophales bacterium]|nr:hypothetical protein [Syntrophales bacterium]
MRKIAILVCTALMLGCASLPPTIQRGEYQNYRYGFIVQIPEKGWTLTKAVPEMFAGYLVPEAPERTLLMFHNPQTKGLLAVQGGTLALSYEIILTLQERLTEYVEPFLDLDWYLIVNGDTEIRSSYQFYHCDASGLDWQEVAGKRPLPGLLHASRGSVYPIKGETCTVTFYLFSDPETFNENMKVLYRMAKSFSSGEAFTTKAYNR